MSENNLIFTMSTSGPAEGLAVRCRSYPGRADGPLAHGPFIVLDIGPFGLHADAASLRRIRDVIDAFLAGPDGAARAAATGESSPEGGES